MILRNNYVPTPDVQHTGEQVAIRNLRYNDTFQYEGLPGVYTIHSTDPIKIKRPDGWIVRCGDEKKIVYKCSKDVTSR